MLPMSRTNLWGRDTERRVEFDWAVMLDGKGCCSGSRVATLNLAPQIYESALQGAESPSTDWNIYAQLIDALIENSFRIFWSIELSLKPE